MINDLLLNNFLISIVPINIRNLGILASEIYEVVNSSFPLIMNEIFKLCDEGKIPPSNTSRKFCT